jgi:acetylornithine deacetylase/succinyl-diaminopimelate desuccinylase-like protein
MTIASPLLRGSSTNSELQRRLEPERVIRWALELVGIPSPTGDSRAAAAYYAEQLRDLGLPSGRRLDVLFDEEIPGSPSVIAYVEGAHPGPTLELAGHLDVIPVEQDPPFIRDGVLYGRGACDMKGPLAAVLETTRLLASVRDQMHGRLMVCAYGLHEAPLGRAQSLLRLIERGFIGDAVIAVEGPVDAVAITGRGMSTFEITVERPGEPLHELQAPAGMPHPLWVGVEVANALRAWDAELRAGPSLPYVGTESLFVGQIEGGDFYNRVPTRCRIVGTRRYLPQRRFPEIQAEFEARLEPVRRTTTASIRLDLVKTKDGFATAEGDPVVEALTAAYEAVTGRSVLLAAFSAVGDASNFANEGGVPAVYYGCGLERAHATPEYVALENLERQARVLTDAAARYLGVA